LRLYSRALTGRYRGFDGVLFNL